MNLRPLLTRVDLDGDALARDQESALSDSFKRRARAELPANAESAVSLPCARVIPQTTVHNLQPGCIAKRT